MEQKIISNEKQKPSAAKVNFFWWLFPSLLLAFIRFAGLGESGTGTFYFLIIMLLLSLGQAPFHWLVLRQKYPEQERKNIRRVLTMPFLIFFGTWLLIIVFMIFMGPG